MAHDFSLSRLKVLQVKTPALFLRNLVHRRPPADFVTTIESILHTITSIFQTITSPVFSELVLIIQSGDVYHFLWHICDTLRMMYIVRLFKSVFLLVDSEKSSEGSAADMGGSCKKGDC
jgi:hypothetical protein